MTAPEILRILRALNVRAEQIDDCLYRVPASRLDAHAAAAMLSSLPEGTVFAPAPGCGEWHVRIPSAPDVAAPLASERVAYVLDEQRSFIGWTPEKLAAQAGLATQTVRNALKGEDTYASTLFAIIAALDLTFADFLEMCDE